MWGFGGRKSLDTLLAYAYEVDRDDDPAVGGTGALAVMVAVGGIGAVGRVSDPGDGVGMSS